MSTSDSRQLNSSGFLPLVIAVTGHRDLVDSEVPRIREITRHLFQDLPADGHVTAG